MKFDRRNLDLAQEGDLLASYRGKLCIYLGKKHVPLLGMPAHYGWWGNACWFAETGRVATLSNTEMDYMKYRIVSRFEGSEG